MLPRCSACPRPPPSRLHLALCRTCVQVTLPNGKPLPVLLLANKCDLPDHKVDKTSLDAFCSEHGFIGWMETSAKENINIEESVTTLINNILSHKGACVRGPAWRVGVGGAGTPRRGPRARRPTPARASAPASSPRPRAPFCVCRPVERERRGALGARHRQGVARRQGGPQRQQEGVRVLKGAPARLRVRVTCARVHRSSQSRVVVVQGSPGDARAAISNWRARRHAKRRARARRPPAYARAHAAAMFSRALFLARARAGLRRLSTRAAGGAGGPEGGVKGNGGTFAPIALSAGGLLPFLFWGLQHDKLAAKRQPYFDPLVARVVAATGLAPLQFFLSGDQETVRRRFVTYGASILAFMSGVQWGLAMAAPVYRPSQYAVASLPSLWAWLALNQDLTNVTPHSMLACGFVGVYFYDEALVKRRLAPGWYSALRVPLTVVVTMTIVGSAYNGREKPSEAW